MQRRSFLTLLGGTAAAWPLTARAQQPAMPVIGYINAGSPEPAANLVAAFRMGLSETGYVEGRSVAIEYRWAHNDFSRLPEMATDLVRRRVSAIHAPGIAAALAAKAATTTVPIVFQTGGDPVQLGLVPSLNRPGGNVTGFTNIGAELGAKRLGLLNELLPAAARFAVLVNPTSPNTESVTKEAQAAASAISRQVEVLSASTNREIETAFERIVEERVDAILVTPNTFLDSRRVQLITLAAHNKLPAIYGHREFSEIGGLMSYGPSTAEQWRQGGIYVGRILKGEKPADLPVQQPTKFEFIINLQTARSLHLAVPPTLLAIADEVIE